MKKTLLYVLCILFVLLSLGCSAEKSTVFFSDDQLSAMGNTVECALDLLELHEDDAVVDTPLGYFGKNAPGTAGDSPSDITRAYKQTVSFCGKQLSAYAVFKMEEDEMFFYGTEDTLPDSDKYYTYAERCAAALCEQFGVPYSYNVNDVGYTCDGNAPDYQALFQDFTTGEETDYLQFQWINPQENVGKIVYRVTKQSDGFLLYVRMYVDDFFTIEDS